jgi:hypothetical protein
MKAIVSDTAPQLGSLASLSDVPIVRLLRSCQTGASALGVLVGIVTASKFAGKGEWPAQTTGNTGQIRPVTVARGVGAFRKETGCAPNARKNARRTGTCK